MFCFLFFVSLFHFKRYKLWSVPVLLSFSFANFNGDLDLLGISKSAFEPFLECLLHLDCHGVMEELKYYNEKKWNRHQEQDFCLCRVGSCSGDCHLLATNMNTNKVSCKLLNSSGNPKLKLRFQFHREFLWSQCARMCNAKFPPSHYRWTTGW